MKIKKKKNIKNRGWFTLNTEFEWKYQGLESQVTEELTLEPVIAGLISQSFWMKRNAALSVKTQGGHT